MVFEDLLSLGDAVYVGVLDLEPPVWLHLLEGCVYVQF